MHLTLTIGNDPKTVKRFMIPTRTFLRFGATVAQNVNTFHQIIKKKLNCFDPRCSF